MVRGDGEARHHLSTLTLMEYLGGEVVASNTEAVLERKVVVLVKG